MGNDGVEVELMIVNLILDLRSQISSQRLIDLYVKFLITYHLNSVSELVICLLFII